MPAPAPEPVVRPERAAFAGVIVNTALAAVKLVAGVAGNSFALVADAIESLADIAGSVVVWGALHYGARPPDAEHPFGHGKAEALAALAVAAMIVGAGVVIAIRAIANLSSPQLTPEWFTLVVLAGVVVIKEGMYRFTRRAARASDSAASFADAWHHRSDAITSAAAFVGISLALLGGPDWAKADDWAALAAAAVIVLNGVLLSRGPYAELLDRAAPEVAARCAEVALRVEGIRAIERCEARKMGRVYRVIMHAEVDGSMRVEDAHALTGKIKARMREEMPRVASVLVHVEPHRPG
jgi:cation diffusion facilitator family transporter